MRSGLRSIYFLGRIVFLSAAALCAGFVCFSVGAQSGAVDLEGRNVDPLKVTDGKAVVLVFVRTDCPVSNRYAPEIRRLSAKYEKSAAFWLVYPDRKESSEQIRKHLQEYSYAIPALRDPQRSLVKESQAQVTPEVAVFDTMHRLEYHGRIDDLYQDLGRARPVATTHELDEAITAVLNGKTPPVNQPGVGCYISDMN